MSSVEDDPLSNSGISQQESEQREELPLSEPIQNDGVLPTSTVFNLSSYDMDQVQDPEPKV